MADVHPAPSREVVVASQSALDELVAVIRVAMAVIFGVWLYLANQGSADPTRDRSPIKNLLPFQSVVLDRPPDEQRMFRSLQVGLLEAEHVRAVSGAWPQAEALAVDGVEPFAPDPTNRGATYRWQLVRSGYTIGYLGTPDRSDALAWLVFVQEPDPSVPPEPFQNDEEHHRLVTGLVLHVSTWTRPAAVGVPTTLPRLPQGEGWSQLFAVGPSVTH